MRIIRVPSSDQAISHYNEALRLQFGFAKAHFDLGLALYPAKKLAQGDFVEEILKAVAVEPYDPLVLGAYGHKRPKYQEMISDEALNSVPVHPSGAGLPG